MSDPPPLLERLGVAYFERLSRGVEVVDEDGVHVLNERELAGLRAIERGTIARAALAGTLSTIASGTAEVWAGKLLGPDPSIASLGVKVEMWAVILGATAVASVIEIGYLYWDSLRAVHRLSVVAGLELFASSSREKTAVVNALARAALELPNPPRGRLGLDATREASKLELLVASLVYKAKTSVTTFLLKALIRRALGRTALRSYLATLLPFVAVPVTAIWNGVVAWLVVREAMLRVLGPSAARQLVGLSIGAEALSQGAREASLRAVACAAVRSVDLHPNLGSLLDEVSAAVGEPQVDAVDDTPRFLREVASLDERGAAVVLRLLCVAAVIDGRITRGERRLLGEAFAARGVVFDEGPLDRLRRRLLQGRAVSEADVEALVPRIRSLAPDGGAPVEG